MKDKEQALVVEMIAITLKSLFRVAGLVEQRELRELLHEEIRHLDWCMSKLYPIEEKNHE